MKRLLLLLLLGLILLALPRLYPSEDLPLRRTDFAIEGIDVSRYQADIDWEVVAAADFDFAFVKATEGLSHIDPKFALNWLDLQQAGMRRGAYHFFRPEISGENQAFHFINTVELVGGDLPPVLDVEVIGQLSSDELVGQIEDWLELTELHYEVKPILYSGQKFYNRHLAGRFDDYPLWLARYADRKPVAACGREFQFWQYADQGQIAGIEGNVDLNVFTGDALDLLELCIPLQPSFEEPAQLVK